MMNEIYLIIEILGYKKMMLRKYILRFIFIEFRLMIIL